ncbi:hypothetical protein D3C74_285520 [compost metagenome]
MRVVHAAHAHAQLEPQVLLVAQRAGDRDDVPRPDVQRELGVQPRRVDDDLLDGVLEPYAGLGEHLRQDVHGLVEPPAVRASARSGQHHGAHQTAVARGVPRAVGPEHARADLDDLERLAPTRARPRHELLAGHVALRDLLPLDGVGRAARRPVVGARHRSSPFIWNVGVASSAAASAALAASRRFTPSGSAWICSCSARIALMSISGRGGQPGR